MPGTITFKPIEANLTGKDKDLLGKMDPYLSFHIGHHRVKTQVCKSGGEHPVWNDEITVDVKNQAIVTVDLKDKDTIIDDKIGTFEVDLHELESQGQLKKWYPIFHKSIPAGEVLLEVVYHGGNIGGGRQDFDQGLSEPSKDVMIDQAPVNVAVVSEINTPQTISQPLSSGVLAKEAIIKGVDPYGSSNLSPSISQNPFEQFSSQPFPTQVIKTEINMPEKQADIQRVHYHEDEAVFVGQGQFNNRARQMPFGHGHHMPGDPLNPMSYH